MTVTRMMLGRRPQPGTPQPAFGHVALRDDAAAQVEDVVATVLAKALRRPEVPFDADNFVDTGERMVRELDGIDELFQAAAPWSIERAVAEISASGQPSTLGAAEVRGGGWTFYVLRAQVEGRPVTLLRATSPTRGLKPRSRKIAAFVGDELRALPDPVIAFDHHAEALVLGSQVHVVNPAGLERLLIDADAVKKRAPEITDRLVGGVAAPMTTQTRDLIERACAQNSITGRRAERLGSSAALESITADRLREALPDAELDPATFGTGDEIAVETVDHARTLIELAADLYYRPRFEALSRKVNSYQRVPRPV